MDGVAATRAATHKEAARRAFAQQKPSSECGGWSGLFFEFTTGSDTDITAPGIAGVSPSDGFTTAPRNTLVRVDFDESIRTASQSAVVLSDSAGEVPVIRTLSNANRTLTLKLEMPLEADEMHTLTFDGVLDLAGNALLVTTTIFTTDTEIDFVRPRITAASPTANEVDVATDALMTVTFDEPMTPRSVRESITLTDRDAGSAVVPGTVAVAAGGLSATFTPDSPLDPATNYRFDVSGARDLADNPLQNSVFNRFTTGP